jgi:hypothetical protein
LPEKFVKTTIQMCSTWTPRLAGTIQRIHEDWRTRELMVRLDRRVTVAVVVTYTWGEQARGMVTLDLYDTDTVGSVGALQEERSSWLAGLPETESAAR